MNDVEALTLALRLAVTAPTDEKSALALEHAETIAARLTAEEVDQAKAAAEEWTSPPTATGDEPRTISASSCVTRTPSSYVESRIVSHLHSDVVAGRESTCWGRRSS